MSTNNSSYNLAGKTAIITGATSGIGAAIARMLAENGCDIIVNGFGDDKDISDNIASLQQHQIKAYHHHADMRRPSDIADMVKFAKDTFGHIDIIVNNAGVQYIAPIQDFADDKWDDIIAVNLSSAFHMIKHTLPIMLTQHYGRIINIASVHGLVASVNKSAYVAAKHGLIGLTKTIALENAQNHIRCNAICPGWVKTPLVEKQITDNATAANISTSQAVKNLLSEKQPSLQFIDTNHIAEMVIMLCGHIGNGMNGAAITIDGGWTAQ